MAEEYTHRFAPPRVTYLMIACLALALRGLWCPQVRSCLIRILAMWADGFQRRSARVATRSASADWWGDLVAPTSLRLW